MLLTQRQLFLVCSGVRARSPTLLPDFVPYRCEPKVYASASPRRLSEPRFIAYGALQPLRLSSEIVATKLHGQFVTFLDVSPMFSIFDFRFSISPRPLHGRNPESKIEILFDFDFRLRCKESAKTHPNTRGAALENPSAHSDVAKSSRVKSLPLLFESMLLRPESRDSTLLRAIHRSFRSLLRPRHNLVQAGFFVHDRAEQSRPSVVLIRISVERDVSLLEDVSRRKVDANGPKWTKMDANERKLTQMGANGRRWNKVDTNRRNWHTMDAIGQKWTKMDVASGRQWTKWTLMDESGRKWAKMDANCQGVRPLNHEVKG